MSKMKIEDGSLEHRDAAGAPDLVYKLEEIDELTPGHLEILYDIAKVCYISGYTDALSQAAKNRFGDVIKGEVPEEFMYDTFQQYSEQFLENWEKSHARWMVWDFPEESRIDDGPDEQE